MSRPQGHAHRVGQPVSHVTAAIAAGARGLDDFDEAAHHDGQDDGTYQGCRLVDDAVTMPIFQPDDKAQAAIEYKVRPLVNESDVAQWCLGNRYEAEHPNADDARLTERIMLEQLAEIAPG